MSVCIFQHVDGILKAVVFYKIQWKREGNWWTEEAEFQIC
jgi:hypothetical protein